MKREWIGGMILAAWALAITVLAAAVSPPCKRGDPGLYIGRSMHVAGCARQAWVTTTKR